ncbi:MAG: hypothetical protein ACLFTT_17740 [Candidatus Hydrogenedentota bacterium]
MGNDTHTPAGGYRGLDFVLIAVIFALMGAFFWAIRGTGGYGGAMGGTLAGLGWAMLWHGFSRLGGAGRQRPHGMGAMIAAITLGIAAGGLTGYGVYSAWIRGEFYLDYPDGVRSIAPWTGLAMMFFCGLHWGGVTGVFMGWCAPDKRANLMAWGGRILGGVAGAVLAGIIVRVFPHWFLPFYGEGIYQNPDNATCIRAVGSIRNIAPHVGAYLGFLVAELVRKDRRAAGMMLLMGLGFAIPFSVGGLWHAARGSSWDLPFWKFWEMSIGGGGGLAFGLAFYLFNRPVPDAPPHRVTWNERIWPVAVVVSLAVTITVTNAYAGFINLHGLEWPAGVRVLITLGCLFAVEAAFTLWFVRTRMFLNDERSLHSGALMPGWIPLAVLALIVVAGYLVSVPGELQHKNWVLLPLYTLYIVVSIAVAGVLAARRPPNEKNRHANRRPS